jgi:LysR family transcriptional regulator, glycine cleavage system transcriptional activator
MILWWALAGLVAMLGLNCARTTAESPQPENVIHSAPFAQQALKMQHLPSIQALRVFEAAARHLNFTRGGTRLSWFRPGSTGAIARWRRRCITAANGRVLTVTTSPNFASKWLVPRLGKFADSHPEIDLRVSALRRHVDFAADRIDVGIRHGVGDWPHLHVTRLCPELIFPICSPAVAAQSPVHTPEDLKNHVLLHDGDRSGWREWLASFGVNIAQVRQRPVFSDTSLAIDAAIAGQGVALARSALASLDIESKRLVRPLDEAVSAPFAYWIVCPKALAHGPAVEAFRTWLLAQA